MPYLPRYTFPDEPQPLEYKRIPAEGSHGEAELNRLLEAELNRLAVDGWELIAADGGWLYLGRVKP
jgi:hypothetical protein